MREGPVCTHVCARVCVHARCVQLHLHEEKEIGRGVEMREAGREGWRGKKSAAFPSMQLVQRCPPRCPRPTPASISLPPPSEQR